MFGRGRGPLSSFDKLRMKGAVFGAFGLCGGCTASGYGYAILHLAVGVVLPPDGVAGGGDFCFSRHYPPFGVGSWSGGWVWG